MYIHLLIMPNWQYAMRTALTRKHGEDGGGKDDYISSSASPSLHEAIQ